MIATSEEIQALNKFFSTVTVPKEIHLNSATRITNLPNFVHQVLDNLNKPDISDTALRPRYEDLLLIKALLEVKSTTQ